MQVDGSWKSVTSRSSITGSEKLLVMERDHRRRARPALGAEPNQRWRGCGHWNERRQILVRLVSVQRAARTR